MLDVSRMHTVRVTSFGILCDFRVSASSWTERIGIYVDKLWPYSRTQWITINQNCEPCHHLVLGGLIIQYFSFGRARSSALYFSLIIKLLIRGLIITNQLDRNTTLHPALFRHSNNLCIRRWPHRYRSIRNRCDPQPQHCILLQYKKIKKHWISQCTLSLQRTIRTQFIPPISISSAQVIRIQEHFN